MKFRHLAAWSCAIALLGMGATLLLAQTPPAQRPIPIRPAQAKLRAEIVKLRTEVEMLQFDFDLARNSLLEDVKTRRSLQLAGGMMQFAGAIQSAINEASTNPLGETTKAQPKADPNKEAAAAKKAEEEEKKVEAEEAAFIADRKKELARLVASLTEKRMDLEDAERNYREIFH